MSNLNKIANKSTESQTEITMLEENYLEKKIISIEKSIKLLYELLNTKENKIPRMQR